MTNGELENEENIGSNQASGKNSDNKRIILLIVGAIAICCIGIFIFIASGSLLNSDVISSDEATDIAKKAYMEDYNISSDEMSSISISTMYNLSPMNPVYEVTFSKELSKDNQGNTKSYEITYTIDAKTGEIVPTNP